ncbi:lysophospholipid acyltransferase family protein [Alteromonas oceanisediminis]|uniref:lysophospholipid acyltransferase family protein n=1 Tax=Alteromonas oceanisediminis TaxID=2836180 RepID=UPI001BD94474|nr:GNAT family N-acyltransferase [Alteromonas oceanisediminis]MBT0586983.1 GNAT family N-acetyltransferase [Alteromonas oceanisediminis]
MSKSISLNNLSPASSSNVVVRTCLRVLDWLLGIRKMDRLYQSHRMQGLSKEQFADSLIKLLDIRVEGEAELLDKIPRQGPVVLASNHPFGGIEGVILARAISRVRPDLKVLANQGLRLFTELQDYFIFTNPLKEKDPRNGPSLRQCLQHVKQGKALLMFPAGRVSYYQADKKRVSEHTWNRVIARLCHSPDCLFVPIFVSGRNSALFYRLGRIYYRLRMLMLARELLNKRGATVRLDAGFAVKGHLVDSPEHCRALSYAQAAHWQQPWPPDTVGELNPLAEPTHVGSIETELAQLPVEQRLHQHKHFSIYYAWQHQAPNTVREIARLREYVFRQHNEGSGEPLDTDRFDASYTHLFVFDELEREIVGAYRMGQTDRLLAEANGDLNALYLNRMFEFDPTFVNRREPALEMGRSFLIPRLQRSHIGLFLLWRGIGAFVCQFPQYRTLYGTVSISKLYDMRSVALIEKAHVTPSADARPRHALNKAVHAEVAEFYAHTSPVTTLSSFLRSLESDGKDIPVLMRQYLKMGATFHCLGIDPSFNHTPGMLLSVDLPKAPEKLKRLYLGEGNQDDTNWSG